MIYLSEEQESNKLNYAVTVPGFDYKRTCQTCQQIGWHEDLKRLDPFKDMDLGHVTKQNNVQSEKDKPNLFLVITQSTSSKSRSSEKNS